MPINDLEKHPFLDYHENHNYDKSKINGLIIGSFPVYAITDSLTIDNQSIYRDDAQRAFMKFFYGSNLSDLWKILASAFGEEQSLKQREDLNREEKKNEAIHMLFNNDILMTDSLARTNRIGLSSSDDDLMVKDNAPEWVQHQMSVNNGIRYLLNNHPNIQSLFFTSIKENGKSPFGWFKDIFDGEIQNLARYPQVGNAWGSEISIDDRLFKVFFLPTPKHRGIHFTPNRQNPFFDNYLTQVDPEFRDEIVEISTNQRTANQRAKLTQYRWEFLVEAYRQAIIHHNLNFNGTINP